MKSMYIGSGDVSNLMAGVGTKSYGNLLRKFVSNEIPYYNAKASPIDALRTGAVLEDRYQLVLDDNYYPQCKVISKEMDVFKCSLDFAKIVDSEIVDFDELKTCSFNDFLNFEPFRNDNKKGVEYIKKKYKKNYMQVQEQLFCTELDNCNIVFLAVYSYDDGVNYDRIIKDNEFISFRISRDEKAIDAIKAKGMIFQNIKNHIQKIK